jgi:ubiquitin carboxyl-terminal hydrolase 9/24
MDLQSTCLFTMETHFALLTCTTIVYSFQSGKHDAIVKNVHDLLAKLAWDFSPDQLDHLFGCFQVSSTRMV